MNKHGSIWIPFPLPDSAGAQQKLPRVPGAGQSGRCHQCSPLCRQPPRAAVPGEPLIRCVPAIRLIAQTSFPRAAEPIRGRVLIPQQEITGRDTAVPEAMRGHCQPVGTLGAPQGTRGVPRGWQPPGSSGEPRAFPASLGEIMREKWDGKLLMRPSQGVGSTWGGGKEGGGAGGGMGVLVASAPLCCVSWGWGSPQRTPRSVSVSPQRPEEQPDQHSSARCLPRPPRAEAAVSAGAAPQITWGWLWGQQRGQRGSASPDGPSTHLAGTSPTTASAA